MKKLKTVELIGTVNQLFTEYRKLTLTNILLNKNSKIFMWISSVFLVISLFLTFLFTMNFFIWYSIVSGICLLLSILFRILSIRSSRKYVLDTYSHGYSQLINNSYVKYQHNFLFAYRCEKIKDRIDKITIKHEDLIEYYENKSSSIKKSRWLPVSFFVILLLPIWSELIGFIIGHSETIPEMIAAIVLILILFSILLCFIFFQMNSILKTVLFYEADHYQELANILKIIKMIPDK